MKFLVSLFAPFLLAGGIHTASVDSVQLTADNSVAFNTPVDGTSVLQTIYKIQSLVVKRGSADYPIYLVLDCPGGSVYDGENFIQYAKNVPNLHTVTIFAASMCAVIAEALPGTRYVTENGILMFHRAKGQFEGQFEDGEVESQLHLWKSIVRSMEKRNAKRIGISLQDYKEKVKDEWWMYGNENVSEGAADSVANVTCSDELLEAKVTVVTQDLFGEQETSRSACPLLR